MILKYLYHITKNNNKIHILLVDEDMCIYGYIYLNRLSDNEWEVVSVAAVKGYGYKMHDAAMDLIYPSYILPSRDGQIKEKLISTYNKYSERSDVLSESIDNINFDWFNKRYRLKEKMNIEDVEALLNHQDEELKAFQEKY